MINLTLNHDNGPSTFIINQFNKRLLEWFSKNGRIFPWRKENGLYQILIAELLLQKTDAAKVKSIYPGFLEKYPAPDKLQEAPIADLVELLKPVGLVNKAIVLKRLAEFLIDNNNENKDVNSLLSIKGIGQYIANSALIHSQGIKLPLLDPNFIRIYERVFGFRSNLNRPRTDRKLWKSAETVLPDENISNYVYAILDFGALVCTLRSPKCKTCPMFSDVCKGLMSQINS